MARFDGKRALVTGGARGIGRALCEAFARDGADVAAADVLEDDLKETVRIVQGHGRRALSLCLDITDGDAVGGAVDRVLAEMGGIDILVNNAGITADRPLLRMSDADWDRVMAVNTRGTFLLTRAVGRRMLKARSGSIVNISSVIGFMGNPGQANYAASKAAVVGFTRSCAREFAGRGVRVNAVAPGFIETGMTAAMSEEAREAILSQVPLGRVGTVEDVTHAVLFLAGDEASYMTGAVLHVNGGLLM